MSQQPSISSSSSSDTYSSCHRPPPPLANVHTTLVEPRRGTAGDAQQSKTLRTNREVVRTTAASSSLELGLNCVRGVMVRYSSRCKRARTASG
jgi:hypothetical protein